MSKSVKWTMAAVLALVLATSAVAYRDQIYVDQIAAKSAEAARRKDWTQLEQHTRAWLAKRSDPQAQFWLATALREQHRFSEAVATHSQVPLDGPRGIDAAVDRMEMQFHVLHDTQDSLALAETLLQRDPKLASPRRQLIYYYAMTLQRISLLREIRLAIHYQADLPEHYLYLMTLEDLSFRFRDYEFATREWSAAAPDSAFLRSAHTAQVVRLARFRALSTPTAEMSRDYAQIRRAAASSLEPFESEPAVLETLLLLAVDDALTDEVGRLLQRVPDSAVDDPVFWKYRGWYAAQTGDHRQAEDSYQQALKLHPLGWQTRHEYANLLRLMGKPEEAGRQQLIASNGTAIAAEIRLLPNVEKATAALLTRLAGFARDCGDWDVAHGVVRRLPPKKS